MAIDRHSIIDWLLPFCELGTASIIMYPKGKSDGPGWANVTKAIAAYRAGKLSNEQFLSITQDGKKYVITGGTRLGLVPYRDEMVARFCMDFDDHTGHEGRIFRTSKVEPPNI